MARSKPHLAELLVNCTNTLGEGVQWDAEAKRVRWVDIHGARLHGCAADGSDHQDIDTGERMGSFALDADGAMLAAFASGLYRYDPETGGKALIAAFEPEKVATRMNDGRCDRAGRFIVGGVEETGLKPLSSVISYDGGGPPAMLIDQVGCANSLCFSPDGAAMYFTDTPGRMIYVYDYDPATGSLGDRRVFATLGEDEGSPDGSCIDADGRLWNAQFNGARVQAYDPDGGKGPTLYLPCPQITCACFGGPDLGTLYVTTGREGMSAADLAAAPLSGALYAFDAKGAFGATGLPESRFGKRLADLNR